MTAPALTDDLSAIREGLAALPRADNHVPGAAVDPAGIVVVPGHRAALDPDRALVVGNRGMGKSFWAHALAADAARQKAAAVFRELAMLEGRIGFNASERSDQIAPTPAALREALVACNDPDILWRAVLVRWAAVELAGHDDVAAVPGTFTSVVDWVRSGSERVDSLLTLLDDRAAQAGKKLLLVFDALDRLGDDWRITRLLTASLLKRALAVQSYRALRLKLFMRRDQFEDPVLFQFPDGSKLRNTRVDLTWSSNDLYALLFTRLQQRPASTEAFVRVSARPRSPYGQQIFEPGGDSIRSVINVIAGEYMGADKKRGRVYTWLPLHLSDARGETSPRTFLTAWREAARHGPPPIDRAVDHLGLIEGVRRASEDRLQELQEDYWWIRVALAPLRGQMVPMDRALLEQLWRENVTAGRIRTESAGKGLAPVQLEDAAKTAEAALIDALSAIGVIEIRSNGKVNVPDIFRVEAGIKRKGGVKPPKRLPPDP
jgi:hypothetical protein